MGYKIIRFLIRDGNKLGCWIWSIDNFKILWNNDEVIIRNNKNIIKKEFVNNDDVYKVGNELFFIKKNILLV